MEEKLTLEQATDRLQELTEQLGKGNIGFEESMELYREAFGRLTFCCEKMNAYNSEIKDISTKIEEMMREGEEADD